MENGVVLSPMKIWTYRERENRIKAGKKKEGKKNGDIVEKTGKRKKIKRRNKTTFKIFMGLLLY